MSTAVKIQTADILANLPTGSGYSGLYPSMKGSFKSDDGATQIPCVHHNGLTQL